MKREDAFTMNRPINIREALSEVEYETMNAGRCSRCRKPFNRVLVLVRPYNQWLCDTCASLLYHTILKMVIPEYDEETTNTETQESRERDDNDLRMAV